MREAEDTWRPELAVDTGSRDAARDARRLDAPRVDVAPPVQRIEQKWYHHLPADPGFMDYIAFFPLSLYKCVPLLLPSLRSGIGTRMRERGWAPRRPGVYLPMRD